MELLEVAKQDNAIAVLALLVSVFALIAVIYVVRAGSKAKSDDKTDDTLSDVVKLLGHTLVEITGTLQAMAGPLQAMAGQLDNIGAVSVQQKSVLVAIRDRQVGDGQALTQLTEGIATHEQKATERHETLYNNVTETLRLVPASLQQITTQNAALPKVVAEKVVFSTEQVIKTVLGELKSISAQLAFLRDYAHNCPSKKADPLAIEPVVKINNDTKEKPTDEPEKPST